MFKNTIDELVNLYMNGYSFSDIAKQKMISRNLVISIISRKYDPTELKNQKEEIIISRIKELIKQSYSVKETAKILNLSYSQVKDRCKKHNIVNNAKRGVKTKK